MEEGLVMNKNKMLWNKLKNIVKNKEEGYSNLNLLFHELIKKQQSEDGTIMEYYFSENQEPIKIYKPQEQIKLEELKQFNQSLVDSTGIKLWPSEEILAYYIANHFETYFQKFQYVAELGSGYSGLASLAYAISHRKTDKIVNLLISDGNDDCVQRLQENILLNEKLFSQIYFGDQQLNNKSSDFQQNGVIVNVSKLLWTENFKSQTKYELIIISDCLFFQDFHDALIHVIFELLNQNNKDSFCLIIGPRRGDKMNKFLDKAKLKFSIEILEIPYDLQQQLNNNEKHINFNEENDKIYFIKLSHY